MTPRFDDLIEDDVTGAERTRLEKVHELLVAAGAPPELSPRLESGPTLAMTLGKADKPRDSNSPMRLRLAATAVVVYIDRHFRNAREGKLLKLRAVHVGQEELSDG